MLKNAVGCRLANCVKTLAQFKLSRCSCSQQQYQLSTASAVPEPLPQHSDGHNDISRTEDGSVDTTKVSSERKKDFTLKKKFTLPPELRLVLPDFMPEPDWSRRNPVAEKLERMDMLRRRQVVDIPEFYVGSILAVTVSDQFATKCANRFVGICIARDDRGLRHHITLRNVIDGQGVEVRYNVYNPLIQKIEVLKLEKRLDELLYYLRDALPEYSTVPFNMEQISLAPGSRVPVNPVKVKLRPPPWTKRWERLEFKGIDPESWALVPEQWKMKFHSLNREPWKKYDIVEQYKKQITREDQKVIFDDLLEFENKQVDKLSGRKQSFLSPFYSEKRKTSLKVGEIKK